MAFTVLTVEKVKSEQWRKAETARGTGTKDGSNKQKCAREYKKKEITIFLNTERNTRVLRVSNGDTV